MLPFSLYYTYAVCVVCVSPQLLNSLHCILSILKEKYMPLSSGNIWASMPLRHSSLSTKIIEGHSEREKVLLRGTQADGRAVFWTVFSLAQEHFPPPYCQGTDQGRQLIKVLIKGPLQLDTMWSDILVFLRKRMPTREQLPLTCSMKYLMMGCPGGWYRGCLPVLLALHYSEGIQKYVSKKKGFYNEPRPPFVFWGFNYCNCLSCDVVCFSCIYFYSVFLLICILYGFVLLHFASLCGWCC